MVSISSMACSANSQDFGFRGELYVLADSSLHVKKCNLYMPHNSDVNWVTDMKIEQEVKAAGGLAIIGTERHESRRVDRQLRGRAGRQGDPGSSVFFVSLADDLMRLFASEKGYSVADDKAARPANLGEHHHRLEQFLERN